MILRTVPLAVVGFALIVAACGGTTTVVVVVTPTDQPVTPTSILPTETKVPLPSATPVPLPTEPSLVGRPRHTAIEILEASQAQKELLRGCDSSANSTLESPKWYDAQAVWTVGCFIGEISDGIIICFEVNDQTLEMKFMITDLSAVTCKP